MHCNVNCRYSLKQNDEHEIFSLKTNADSNAEYRDLMKKQIDQWAMLPQQVFDGKTPLTMANSDNDRETMKQYFDQYIANDLVPLTYLYNKLSIDYDKKLDQPIYDQELVAEKYMEKIISQDWEDTIPMLYLSEQYQNSDYKANYLKRLTNHKIIKKIVEFDLISAGMNKEKDQALIFYEVNSKYDLTLLMRKKGDVWKVGAKIFGKPELYTRENESIKQVANLLAKNQLAHAYEILKKYSDIFVDSADFQYYWGYYYLLSKMEKKAQEFLFNSIVIEPGFFDAKALYATTLITDKKFSEAKRLYEEILQVYPDEIRTLNNLASIHLQDGNYNEAEKLLEHCLRLDKNFEYALRNKEKLAEFRKQ